MKKDKKAKVQAEEPIVLDIPEDEIWTYQIEGLAAPCINKPYKHFLLKKIIFIASIIVAVSLSVYFSILLIANKDAFNYERLANGNYQLTKFSNTGYIEEIDIDYAITVNYDKNNKDPETNFTLVKDERKVTEIKAFAINEDNVLKVINIGPDVEKIDGKAFYSCWALERIEVDENNKYYCDIDGVLYNKDKTKIIMYPCNHDEYLRQKYGYKEELLRDDVTDEYRQKIQTYVIPSTVKTIGELCFNYANLRDIYLPEGLERIETLAVFKLHEPQEKDWNVASLENIYSYKPNGVVEDSTFVSKEALGTVYNSLPEGLKYIGSDAFSYNQALTYMYVPASVTYMGHHAFWDNVYKEDGNLKGLTEINVAKSEAEFEAINPGDQWIPKYDYLLFKKNVNVNYSVERK